MHWSHKNCNAQKLIIAGSILLMTSGCGQPMLRQYSSIRPKTASLDRSSILPIQQTTFRSQDSRFDGYSGLTTSERSPSAKLAMPELDAEPNTASTASEKKEIAPLNFNADDIRRRMNQKAAEDLKKAALLQDYDERWSVVSKTEISDAKPMTPPEVPPATPPESDQPRNSFSETDMIIPDRSFVERLKDLYDTDNAKSFVRKNFRRIQAPFNALLDKEDQVDEANTVAVEASSEGSSAEISADSVDTLGFDDALTGLINEAENSLANWPRLNDGQPLDPDQFRLRQQDLRILYLVANRDNDALRTAQFATAEEQEFWQELMLALKHFRQVKSTSDRQRFGQTVRQIRSAADRLVPLAQLELRRAEFCARIHSFGRIDVFPSSDFNPGDPILIYAELANVASELTFAGVHKTDFDAVLQILHAGEEEPIETIELKNIVDESTSRRRDYFQSFELTIPAHLSTGSYEVKLRLHDTTSNQTVEQRLPFQVR